MPFQSIANTSFIEQVVSSEDEAQRGRRSVIYGPVAGRYDTAWGTESVCSVKIEVVVHTPLVKINITATCAVKASRLGLIK